MRLRIAADVFTDAVRRAAGNLPPRPAAAVPAGVVLCARHGELRIAGGDQEVSTEIGVPALVHRAGDAVVPARLLSGVVKALPPNLIELTVADGRLELVCGDVEFALPMLPMDDRPPLPPPPPVIGTVDAVELARAVDRTVVAAGRDDTLSVFTGVQLELSGEHMTLTATDRFRLAIYELEWRPREPSVGERTALVPGRSLAGLAASLGDHGGRVNVAAAPGKRASMVGFGGSGGTTVLRSLDTRLPELRHYADIAIAATWSVETTALRQAVRAAGLVARRHEPVRLSASGDRLSVVCGDAATGRSRSSLDCVHTGATAPVAFNPKYLLDCLGAVPGARTVLSIARDGTKVLVTADGDDEPTRYRHILMPVRWSG